MEFWTEVRRQVLVEGLSKRAAVKKYSISWHTLEKILKADQKAPGGACDADLHPTIYLL